MCPLPLWACCAIGSSRFVRVREGSFADAVAGFDAGTEWWWCSEDGSRGDCRPSAHVERESRHQDLRSCLDQTDVTDAGQPHSAFEGGKGGLHRSAPSRDEAVIAFEPGGQLGMVLVGTAG